MSMSSEELYDGSNSLLKRLDICNDRILKYSEKIYNEMDEYVDEYIEAYIDTYKDKASILWKLGRYEDALSCSMIVLSIASNDGVLLREDFATTDTSLDILCRRGEGFYTRQMYAESLLYFEKALETNPNNIKALEGKTVSLRELKRYKESFRCIDYLFKIDPNHNFAKEGREYILRLIKNNEDFIIECDKNLADDPKNVDALTDKGRSLNTIGKYTDAVRCFETALVIMPNNVDALVGRALSIELINNACENV